MATESDIRIAVITMIGNFFLAVTAFSIAGYGIAATFVASSVGLGNIATTTIEPAALIAGAVGMIGYCVCIVALLLTKPDSR